MLFIQRTSGACWGRPQRRTSVTSLTLRLSAIVACFVFWREICHPAFSDFCNKIRTSRALSALHRYARNWSSSRHLRLPIFLPLKGARVRSLGYCSARGDSCRLIVDAPLVLIALRYRLGRATRMYRYHMSRIKSKRAARLLGASAIPITKSRRNKPSRRLAGSSGK